MTKNIICHANDCGAQTDDTWYFCEVHFVQCGDHLVPIKECGCRP